jgi:hypothetical protein
MGLLAQVDRHPFWRIAVPVLACLGLVWVGIIIAAFVITLAHASPMDLGLRHTEVDEETGIPWYVREFLDDPAYFEWLLPVKNAAVIAGTGREIANVSTANALNVVEMGGRPYCGSDAEGAATYVTILTVPRDCYHLYAVCATLPAIVSLDGGTTETLLISTVAPFTGNGIFIPAGTQIKAKDTAAGHYVTLYITAW